ncbi:glycosyltransferase family 4 protein [Methanospirillum stamsii]|uniref:Glycosyltransferase subfamily 4-like N-terminal domain-containing protein n=1 Tax=Methanospirillum stamsii TaxID=1277351 RepID=A0A2V2N4C2_9EURY|nr:glycosyltransferase family 4 protein [Methanospirillum stamsii]PWR70093.1 hypothetical protein DLD82_16400 [Methanospirillum stamsii]
MSKIAIISLSNLSQDPRVYRQIDALNNEYKIITAGLAPCGIVEVPFFQLHYFGQKIYQRALLMKFSKNYEHFYWRYGNFQDLGKYLIQEKPDIIIANDIEMLPVALIYKEKAKIIFDAHEYSPLEYEESFLFRFFFKEYKKYLVDKYVPFVDKMITVSEGISKQYYKDTCIKSIVITNAPDFQNLSPTHVNPGKIRLVHHGAAHPSRKIELEINLMNYLDPSLYELHLFLVPSECRYVRNLKKLALEKSNIFFHEPVQMKMLANTINQYDIGVYLLPPANFNNEFALPNKFFEFIQARLAIAIGPSPEMADYVNKFNLGVVSSDFNPKNLANAINSMSYQTIMHHKENAHNIAKKFCSKENQTIIKSIVKEIIENR